MTRIALISDIHGNLTALQAVLDDIQKRGVHKIYCLGDMIGKGPRGSACIALVRQHCEKVIRGNWEVFIHDEIDDDYIRWMQQELTEEDYTYMKSLPFFIEWEQNGKLIRCFHASPRSEFERIFPEYHTKEQCLSLFDNTAETNSLGEARTPDIIFYGDVHVALLRSYDTKLLCNIGSVGLDVTDATYTIIDDAHGANAITFMRVPYDREAELAAARAAGLASYALYEDEILYEERQLAR